MKLLLHFLPYKSVDQQTEPEIKVPQFQALSLVCSCPCFEGNMSLQSMVRLLDVDVAQWRAGATAATQHWYSDPELCFER